MDLLRRLAWIVGDAGRDLGAGAPKAPPAQSFIGHSASAAPAQHAPTGAVGAGNAAEPADDCSVAVSGFAFRGVTSPK